MLFLYETSSKKIFFYDRVCKVFLLFLSVLYLYYVTYYSVELDEEYPHFVTVDCAASALKSIEVVKGTYRIRCICHRLSTTSKNMTKVVKKKRATFRKIIDNSRSIVKKINKSSHKNDFEPTLKPMVKTRFYTINDLLKGITNH